MSRILLIIPSATGVGGTERMVFNLARLLSSDHDVVICSFDPPGTSPRLNADVPFFALGQGPNLPLPIRWITYGVQARRLAALKRRLGTELSISNLWRADLVSILSGGADLKIALCHINIVGNRTNAMMLKLRPAVRRIYSRFDKVVGVSETLIDELRQLYNLREEKTTFVDNFVEINQSIPPIASLPKSRLVWCGRFVPEKNVAALLDIFAGIIKHHASAQLMLIGDGPQLTELQERAKELGLKLGSSADDERAEVIFVGQVENPLTLMSNCSLLVLTSIAEGLPMVLLEAISLGLPIAASDCAAGGVCSLLLKKDQHSPRRTDPETSSLGLLLPIPDVATPETIACWVNEISALLDDQSALMGMRKGALRRSKDFSPDVARRKWLELIDNLLHDPMIGNHKALAADEAPDA